MFYRRAIRCGFVSLLVIAAWSQSIEAQVIWSGRGSSRVWSIDPSGPCGTPPSERYLQAIGTTMSASNAAFLIVGLNMSTTDPDLVALPYDVLITGHPSGQNPPLAIPPYTGGSPCWHQGTSTFPHDAALSAAVASNPLNPIPGIGTWRAFVIPLGPQSLPSSAAANMEAYYTLDHYGDALEVMNDVKGFVSGIITNSIPPDTILRYQSPAFGPQEFTKMHFPQRPDSFGMDINFTYPKVLADDWLCTQSDPVDDIRFWFSAQGDWFDPFGDLRGQISNIHLSIHSNIPDPDEDGPLFSEPGTLLWESDFPPDSPEVIINYYATETLQDWYDPNLQEYVPGEHSNIYECRIAVFDEPFIQEEDSIYWLDVSIATDDSLAPAMFLGWKTSHRAYYPAGHADRHFMDDGVWGDFPFPIWQNLTYPGGPHVGESLDLAFTLNSEIVSLAVCHDSLWYDEESCGFDAYYVTGIPEMNHDCFVNVFDLFLLAQDYNLTGPNLSGDLNGDLFCDIVDLQILLANYGQTASPCIPDPLSSNVFEGEIALSFSTDPATIVSTAAQIPGMHQVHVVIDGWTNATILEYQIETSANISIMNHQVTPYPHSLVSPLAFDPDGQHTYRAYAVTSTTWPSGPILWTTINYFLTDTNPATIEFTRVAFAPADGRNRWTTSGADRWHIFSYMYNDGINGGVNTDVTGDTPTPFRIVSVAPNPFNPTTTVHFTLPSAMPVTAEVWSVSGERVRVLANQRLFGGGDNQLIWDGLNDQGSTVASGVYFIRLVTPIGVKTASVVPLK